MSLPPVPFCDLRVSDDDVAYALCEEGDASAGAVTTTITAVRPDGSIAPGWPVRLAGGSTAGFFEFGPQGGIFVATTDGRDATISALDQAGAALPGWPRTVPGGIENAEIDLQGRIRIARHEWTEGQCGPAARTVYSMLDADGQVPSGWPILLAGWSSDPSLSEDGAIAVVTEGGRGIAYADTGDVVVGWPVSGVGVSVGCYSGSTPRPAGPDGSVILGDGRATMIRWDGTIAPGWPVQLPYEIAIPCRQCTPGPASPMDPAVGRMGVWVAAYDGDLPVVVGVDRAGSLPSAWQQHIGRAGDEIMWLRVAPTGRVWAAVSADQGTDQVRSALYLVAEDRILDE